MGSPGRRNAKPLRRLRAPVKPSLFPEPPARAPEPPETWHDVTFEGHNCEPRGLHTIPSWLRIDGLDDLPPV